MSGATVPLQVLIEANEALRSVKNLPGSASPAEWMRVALRCANVHGELGYYVDRIAGAAAVDVVRSPA